MENQPETLPYMDIFSFGGFMTELWGYGDQLTNMLQPFWALPLLGITGLKAKDIFPYTLYLFIIGIFIFIIGELQISPATCDDDSPSNFARFSNIFFAVS